MARIARLVVPGAPHLVTQRGDGGQRAFFEDADYRLYRDLLAEAADSAQSQVWAYCLLPDQVHAVLVPSDSDGVRRTFADLHRRYTKHINARRGRTGHLWQGRFSSTAMDEDHVVAAIRYVSLAPVRAGLAARAWDWPWSSVRAHLAGRDDAVVRVAPALSRVGGFATFLGAPFDPANEFDPVRLALTTGRPLGSAAWVAALEQSSGRALAPRKRGPKPRAMA
jgi:putative transposase